MNLWFGTYFHYGVRFHQRYNKGDHMELFERLEDALKCAKFALYNRDLNFGLSILSIENGTDCAKEIYRADRHNRLVKVKE